MKPEEKKDLNIAELEEAILERVAGGNADLLPDIDAWCKDNTTCPTNSGNCVSGCACT